FLIQATDKVKETQYNPIFLVIDPNAKQQRKDDEKGRCIKVNDIPLFVKSDIVRNSFEKYGRICRFSMIIRGPWQITFIIYESLDFIQQFYDNIWSILLMEFSVRIEPTNITEIQTALR
ncbi:5727_t:CDS:1, partial [Funneliformis geosporum]